MSVEWFYMNSGQIYGPFTAAQLHQYAIAGYFAPTDHVCRRGDGYWTPAAKVKGLFDPPSTAAPPPAPDDSSTGTVGTPAVLARNPKLIDCPDCGKSVSHRAEQCPHCGCPITTGSTRSPSRPVAPVEKPAPIRAELAERARPKPTERPRAKRSKIGQRVVLALIGAILLIFVCVFISDMETSSTTTQTDKPRTKDKQQKTLSQTEQRGLVAIKAADDAIAGKSIRPEEYGVTKEDIFDVFKARVMILGRQYREATKQETMDSLDRESKKLVAGMERVDPNHPLTIEIRDSLK